MRVVRLPRSTLEVGVVLNTVVVGIPAVSDSVEVLLSVVISPAVVSKEPCLLATCLSVVLEVVFTVVDSGSILLSVVVMFRCVVTVVVVNGESESAVDWPVACPVEVCAAEGSPVLPKVETWLSFSLDVDAGVASVVRKGATVTCLSELFKDATALISSAEEFASF